MQVNTLNSNLGPRARSALKENPRVVRAKSAHAGNRTESMFAEMHSAEMGETDPTQWMDGEAGIGEDFGSGDSEEEGEWEEEDEFGFGSDVFGSGDEGLFEEEDDDLEDIDEGVPEGLLCQECEAESAKST
jgi:hypothetical protein